ncbi:MAG: LysR family transcriptional regulator [Candidatus Dechloromonas phosphoritropha]
MKPPQDAELERAFGVRLFERSTRKLSLTPSGEVFHQHALWTMTSRPEVPMKSARGFPYAPSDRCCQSSILPQMWISFRSKSEGRGAERPGCCGPPAKMARIDFGQRKQKSTPLPQPNSGSVACSAKASGQVVY